MLTHSTIGHNIRLLMIVQLSVLVELDPKPQLEILHVNVSRFVDLDSPEHCTTTDNDIPQEVRLQNYAHGYDWLNLEFREIPRSLFPLAGLRS